jgi:hypothetical protein
VEGELVSFMFSILKGIIANINIISVIYVSQILTAVPSIPKNEKIPDKIGQIMI